MKTPKLIRKAGELLSAKKSKQRREKDCFKEILQKLKARKRKLKDKLKTESNRERREQIRKDLAIIQAQRKKGLKTLKDLK